jgi:hypothetical protein
VMSWLLTHLDLGGTVFGKEHHSKEKGKVAHVCFYKSKDF